MTTLLLPLDVLIQGDLTVAGSLPTVQRTDIEQTSNAHYMIPFESWRKWNDVASPLDTNANVAGVGITGAAESFATSIEHHGSIVKTTILIDLTGLNSGGTADDIIGDDGTGKAYLGQITAAVNGTILGGKLTCLETPATGDDDIDIHSATEDTGVEDTAIADLTETKLCNSGDLTVGSEVMVTAPAANQYLYLTGGTGGDATYTAGRLMLEFWGTSARDDLGIAGNTFATGVPTIETRDVKGEGAVTLYGRAQRQLPPEYESAQTVTLRANAGMVTTVADNSATIDFSVYESDKAAAAGGSPTDLCETDAININGDTTLSNCDFTITATSLTAGDWLDIRMALAVNDAATATVVKARVGYVAILADIRG